MAQPELIRDIEARVKKSGDAMTGHLTGQYFQGTWLQTTRTTDLNYSPSRIAVISNDGWIYYRTPSELANDIGLTNNYVLKTGDTMTGNLTAPKFIGSLQGNADTANKLSTARNIKLGTAVSSTATKFDGSKDITIPVTEVKEAYLTWGGRNLSDKYAPIDAAMIPMLGANRLAFMPADGIEIQYSIDNGSTWSDYGASNKEKINLFNGNSSNFIIGKNHNVGIDKSQYQVRIIITTNIAKVYTILNKFCIYVTTNGSSDCWCSIDGKTKGNVDSGTDIWTNFADKAPVSGWSGWNIINTNKIITYGSGNRSDQYQKLKFTFGVTSHPASSSYDGLTILKIMGFGGVGWITPSNLAKYGRMYTYDAYQNVTFPAKVIATSFDGNLSGNADTASRLNISATDNAIARFNGTNGAIQNSLLIIEDNGLLTLRDGNHCGAKIGSAYITSASLSNGEVVLQNGHLRFGSDSWDYNQWAGLKYTHSGKIIYLGLADGTIFSANSAQSGGTLALPGIRYFSINGKTAIDANDGWLRINESKAFSSGIYFGLNVVRTDGQFQVGDNGNKFYANSSGNGYFSNTLGIGGANTSYKLYVNGISYFNGNTTINGQLKIQGAGNSNNSQDSNASLVVQGGLSVAKQLSAKTVRIDGSSSDTNGSTTQGCTVHFNKTQNCIEFVFD